MNQMILLNFGDNTELKSKILEFINEVNFILKKKN